MSNNFLRFLTNNFTVYKLHKMNKFKLFMNITCDIPPCESEEGRSPNEDSHGGCRL